MVVVEYWFIDPCLFALMIKFSKLRSIGTYCDWSCGGIHHLKLVCCDAERIQGEKWHQGRLWRQNRDDHVDFLGVTFRSKRKGWGWRDKLRPRAASFCAEQALYFCLWNLWQDEMINWCILSLGLLMIRADEGFSINSGRHDRLFIPITAMTFWRTLACYCIKDRLDLLTILWLLW